MNSKKNPSRSQVTRQILMRTLEKLASKHGIENVSVKDIVETAGQKNKSALHYHFKDRQGLIDAVLRARFSEILKKRGELFHEILAHKPNPTLRDICRLWIEPAFSLSRTDAGFRRFVKTFAMRNVLLNQPMQEIGEGNLPEHEIQISIILRSHIGHLDESLRRERTIAVIRFVALSMAHHATKPGAFRGPHSDIFLSNLIDEATGIFSIEVSEETRKLLAADKKSNSKSRSKSGR